MVGRGLAGVGSGFGSALGVASTGCCAGLLDSTMGAGGSERSGIAQAVTSNGIKNTGVALCIFSFRRNRS